LKFFLKYNIKKKGSNCVSPSDFFGLFFTQEFIDTLTHFTNSRLAEKKIEGRNITPQIMKKYIAVLLFNGVLGLGCWKDLFSSNGIITLIFKNKNFYKIKKIELGQSFAKNAFPNYESFCFVHTNLSFHEHPLQDTGSKTIKVDYLIEYLNSKFVYYYDIGQYIVIDEGIIPFKGLKSFFFKNKKKNISSTLIKC